ncbi:hypothetical protein PENSTE_c053G00066 [Penicillium steckii]|uniref:PNPLA domain-containing protein n=1 Tax=Penicillium steckii TaxID=303698 RepID=A0A1V6SHS4_9EURO|nr:hypothetical protein PENSTE_c053G00066 [Penicillium steckii]
MSLDGGGIRGIIQLGLLKTLEKKLGPAISLIYIIDLWAGISVGALNEMDLVLNNLSADKCFEKFTEFAKKVFEFEKTPIYGNFKWVRILSGILKDGKYDAEGLEEILKHGLSLYRRIFDFGTTSGISSRICIIASWVSDGKACVLANYRGIGIRPAESAVRCSVAAPGFFKTKDLSGFGPLQDGGVRANNSMSIALRESNVIWRSARGYDLFISVGTGFTDPKLVLDNHSSGNPFRDAAVSRLFRVTMFSPTMDGEQAFQEALNYVPDNMMGSIFRLNQAVDCPLPRLDELEKLEVLRGMTYNVPDDLASAVLVTGCFFFELDEFPTPQNGSYHCQGSILCRTQHPRSIVSRVIEGFPGGSYQTSRGYNLGLLGEDNGCRECGYYRKKVSFFVKSLEEVISIKIANSAFRRTIGGFPVSM